MAFFLRVAFLRVAFLRVFLRVAFLRVAFLRVFLRVAFLRVAFLRVAFFLVAFFLVARFFFAILNPFVARCRRLPYRKEETVRRRVDGTTVTSCTLIGMGRKVAPAKNLLLFEYLEA